MPSKIAVSNVKSPANTPAEVISNVGGMPPEKTITQINDATDPKKRGAAPGTSSGT